MSAVITVIVVIAGYLLGGVALKLLWGWFMVPTLGLPVISLVQALGIMLTVVYLTLQHIPRDEDERKELQYFGFLKSIFAIGIGWIVHLFM